MNLQTKVKITQPKNQITHDSSLLFVGSCFTENIGNLLTNYKFSTIINPCGIAYNPVSVANSIAFLCNKKKIDEEKDLVFWNEKWHSLHHHGRFSNADKQTLLRNIEQEITLSKEELASFSHIFLTLGTAWVFEHTETRQIVNNCHKIPAN
ncbi:MAG: GSCFA domain-containing protein [Flavobacteriaceae bacterium]|nr:GSCFA domain-containing protein [Flavobacteriaceae bacterium]